MPLPADQSDIGICLHGWVVTVEAVGETNGRRSVRRRTERACSEGLAVETAFAIADAAIELLPACALLAFEQHRNAVARLSACGQLQGDRSAAALAMNRYKGDWLHYPQPGMAETLRYLFYDQAEIEWAGEPTVRGATKAAAAWIEHLQGPRIWVHRAIGETPDRVRLEGTIEDTSSEDDGAWRYAAATMIWTRENGNDFRLRSLKVSAFKPIK